MVSGTINSPCNIETSCGSLEDALKTSLLKSNADNQLDYCTAEDSIINGPSYKECIGCLQSTSDQTYLANCESFFYLFCERVTNLTIVLIALKAGCMQKPKKGHIIGLSGTIFISSLVNITDPDTNETLPGDGGAPVGSMTTGTIVGIAVGGGLGVAGMAWLIWIYCRRSRPRRGAGIKIESPPPPDMPMNHRSVYGIQKSSYFKDDIHGRRPPPVHDPSRGHIRTMSNAQHYDSIQRDMAGTNPNVSYHYAPHSKTNGPNAALPTHPAYIPRVMSKLPEPQITSQSRKTHAPDSYALQTYLNAADDFGIHLAPTHDTSSNRTTSSRTPSPSQQEKIPGPPAVAPPAPNLHAGRPRLPSLSFPSLHKLIIPKKNVPPPPELNLQSATPISALGNDPRREMRISKPLAVLDPRFQDKPLGGGPVMANTVPAAFNEDYLKRREANKSPMLSGNSRVYG